MSNDTKAITGTGIGLATLLLVLIGLLFQQNANVNARIDDVRSTIRDLRADVQADIQNLRADVQADIQNLRADVQADIQNLRADVQADIQDLRADIRELREIVINASKGSNPAD